MPLILPQLTFDFDVPIRFCKSCQQSKPPQSFDCPLGRCRDCEKRSQKERQSRYNESHREERRARAKLRYDNDPARYGIEKHRKWRQANPEKVVAATLRHRKKNPNINRLTVGNRRARLLKAEGYYTQAEWQAIKERQGFRCLMCGRCQPDIKLTVDHIQPLSKGGRNSSENLQGLCQSCNSRKNDKVLDLRPA